MSDVLKDKSDAEIEEIYRRATYEDLQDMLNQEKCLNRRRLLRKVMKEKTTKVSEDVRPSQGNTADASKAKSDCNDGINLEKKMKNLDSNYQSPGMSKNIQSEGANIIRKTYLKTSDSPAFSNRSNSDKDEKPVELQIRVDQSTVSQTPSSKQIYSNKTILPPSGNNWNHGKTLADDTSKISLSKSNSVLQNVSSPINAHSNISRVQSVREKFENNNNPPIPFKRVNPVTEGQREGQRGGQTGSVLECKSSQKIAEERNLTIPEEKLRKSSATHIMAMVPQMKRAASNARSAVQMMKEQFIIFCQQNTKEYQNISITNYSKSWTDGLAFCALIHHFYPDSFDFNSLSPENKLHNFTLAFNTAKERARIEPLLDPGDMMILENPDEKCVYTYIQHMYNYLKDHPRNVLKKSETDKK